MLKDYLLMSLANITRRRLRSWLTMLGIFIGIAAVVGLIGLGEGLRTAISAQFGFLGTDVLSVRAQGLDFAGPPGIGVVEPLTEDLIKPIEGVNGVEAVIPRYVESGTLEFNDVQGIGYAMSMPGGKNRKLVETMINMKVVQGRLLKEGDTYLVLLGNNFLSSDAFGKPINAGDRVLISGRPFEVVGIMEKKGSFLFDNIVVMEEDVMLDLFRNGSRDDINILGVKVQDVSRMDRVKEDIEKVLRKERSVKKGEEDFTVESPQNAIESLNSTLFAIQLFVYIIASISLVVGGIGITNTMYTAVLERTREIGIMKAIGAKNSVIFSLFAIESGLMGMVGGLIGILLGMLLAYGGAAAGRAAFGFDLIQANVSPMLILGALIFSFVIGLSAGIVPALQASRMQPVDALRFVK
ncbi:ABC transporter permease [Candidatus Woesearchaeota archaeon]|nr:ABC transporter permease [Candidatus Woesearchaeota archaeon]